jgi:hypothetical protein
MWASLYRWSKKLRLEMYMNYIEDSTPLLRTDKREKLRSLSEDTLTETPSLMPLILEKDVGANG